MAFCLIGCRSQVPSGTDVFSMINNERARHGLPKLTMSARLQQAAQWHAERMQQHEQLSHDLGGSLSQRIGAVNYRWQTIGENIATGTTASDVVQRWLNSSGHRRNALNANYTETGTGQSGKYFCQIFAKPLQQVFHDHQ